MAKKLHNRKKAKSSARNRPILNWQHLPELCLDAIYRHIPLEQLLLGSTELICKSWHFARTRALAKRQTLYLLRDKNSDSVTHLRDNAPYKDNVGEFIKREDGLPLIHQKPLDQLKFSAVYLPTGKLIAKFTSNLLNKLPKITNLAVLSKGGVYTQGLEQMIRLLEHYSAHLVKLHLSLGNFVGNQIAPQAIIRLFETINRPAVLEHLKLNLYFVEEHERPPLSILSRLTSFSLDTRLTLHYVRDPDWLISSFRSHANSATLRSISCDCIHLKQLAQLDPQIVGKFNWLHVLEQNDQIEFVQMVQLFSHFNSLTCLDIVLTLPLNMLARCLAQVHSLVYLKLWIYEQVAEPSNEGEPIIKYQVPSVLELNLYIQAPSHEDMKEIKIAHIFPRLQVIHIRNNVQKCSSCSFERKTASIEKDIQCRRQAKETLLAGCQNLHWIKYDSEDPNAYDGKILMCIPNHVFYQPVFTVRTVRK